MSECNRTIAVQLTLFYTFVQLAGFSLLFFLIFSGPAYTMFFRSLCSSIYSIPVAVTTTIVLYFYLINRQREHIPDPGIF